MPQALVYLDEKEDDKVKEFSIKWKISKAETIKRMVRDYSKYVNFRPESKIEK